MDIERFSATTVAQFFLTGPEDCVSLCVQYLGLPGFLSLSAVNQAFFANAYRLTSAWKFFGYQRRLPTYLGELVRCSSNFAYLNNTAIIDSVPLRVNDFALRRPFCHQL